ncbi:hypothetical protein M885DRAFT_225472 [Pelagophyceae sp. CCMP2097]|nr:hypothetical protein M885DRAFT_225472 [Pelagophyceae sp. CCMP2097]
MSHCIVPGDITWNEKTARLRRCSEVASAVEGIIKNWPRSWRGRWIPHHLVALLAGVIDAELASWRQRRSQCFLNVKFDSAKGTRSGGATCPSDIPPPLAAWRRPRPSTSGFRSSIRPAPPWRRACSPWAPWSLRSGRTVTGTGASSNASI